MSGLTLAELAAKKCVPCEGGVPPLALDQAQQYLRHLEGWQIVGQSLEKEYRFPSYLQGLELAYRLGKIAEEEGHHPDLLIKWRRVRVTLTTHAIKGLSENDFIMAAKADQEYNKLLGR